MPLEYAIQKIQEIKASQRQEVSSWFNLPTPRPKGMDWDLPLDIRIDNTINGV